MKAKCQTRRSRIRMYIYNYDYICIYNYMGMQMYVYFTILYTYIILYSRTIHYHSIFGPTTLHESYPYFDYHVLGKFNSSNLLPIE